APSRARRSLIERIITPNGRLRPGRGRCVPSARAGSREGPAWLGRDRRGRDAVADCDDHVAGQLRGRATILDAALVGAGDDLLAAVGEHTGDLELCAVRAVPRDEYVAGGCAPRGDIRWGGDRGNTRRRC